MGIAAIPLDLRRDCACVFLSLLLVACAACRKDTPAPTGQGSAFSLSDQLLKRHNRGVALMGRFQYAKAEEIFAQLVKEHPQWIAAKVDLAIATLNRQQPGDSDKAIELLDDVLERDPQCLRAVYCRAILLLNAGRPVDALAGFRQVFQADPTDGYAAYYMAQCLFELGEFDQALAQHRRAQEEDPYLRSAYYGAFQAAQRLRRAD